MNNKTDNNIDLKKSATLIPIDSLFDNISSDKKILDLLNDDSSSKSNKQKDFSDDHYSGLKLFNLDTDEIPMLVDPIFPKQSLVSLIGSSDTGKSTLLRQLALSIALGLDEFIGYKLKPKTRNVIFVSTEDDPTSISYSMKKSVKKLLQENSIDESALNHLKFIFDVDTVEHSQTNIIKLLENDLSKTGADLIIIDAFTDIFSGDINSSTKVREFLNQFSKITRVHKCLILFLHHTGKRTEKYSASKNNVLGSQAFEAKMRVLLELKNHPHNEMQRTLTITKGNYISTKLKKKVKVIDFDEEHLLFSNTGNVLSPDNLNSLGKTNPKKEEIKLEIQKMHKDGLSIRKIENALKTMGYKVGKSSIGNYLKEINLVSPKKVESQNIE